LRSGVFDTERTIFPENARAFIPESQIKTGEKLEALHGAQTSEPVLQELTKRCDFVWTKRGLDSTCCVRYFEGYKPQLPRNT
jgi:hypothetical protein